MHNNIKKIHIIFAMTAAFFCAEKSLAQPSENSKKITSEIMLFQQAGSGEIIRGKAGDLCYKIHLSHLQNNVIYFAVQPSHATGTMDLKAFATVWKHNEQVDKIQPNAMIHATATDKTHVNDTVVLSNLIYDQKRNTIDYKACPMNTKNSLTVGSITDVSVFIDPFHPWP